MSYTRKMIEKVRWYLDCYRMYFKINLLTVLEYKLDFLARLIARKSSLYSNTVSRLILKYIR